MYIAWRVGYKIVAFNANSVGVGRKNKFFLCMCSKNCDVIINIIVYIVEVVVCQNCQVIMTSFGCCWYSGGAPQSPNCSSSCNVWLKMGAGDGG